MALSFVGAASATSDSATLPAFTVGDIAIVFAHNDTNTTIPSLPSGWTSIITGVTGGGGSDTAARAGFRVLQAGDTVTGTWTNATQVAVGVYQGQATTTPIPTSAENSPNNTGDNVYPSLTLDDAGGDNWVIGGAGNNGNFTAAAPDGSANTELVRTSQARVELMDTDGGISANWTQSTGGTGGGGKRIGIVVELAALVSILNFQTIAAGGSGAAVVVTVSTRFRTIAAAGSGAAAVGPITTFFRTIAAAGSGAAALATALIKQQAIAAAATGTAGLAAITTFVRTIAAAGSGTAVLGKVTTFRRTIAAAGSGAASVVKKMFVTIAAAGTGTGVVNEAAIHLRTIASNAFGTAAFVTVTTFRIAMSAAASGAAVVVAVFQAGGPPVARIYEFITRRRRRS